MNSLYQIIYGICSEIMALDGAVSMAAELVSIIFTILITSFIVFAPFALLLKFLFFRGKKK